MRSSIPAIGAITIFLLFTLKAHSYPDLIRHGYTNCITCHVSPSGGGVTNDYGRTFSGESLSTFAYKEEESLFHGLIKRDQMPKWLNIGGNIRGVQVHQENAQVKQGFFILMQADVEAAVQHKGFTFDITAGRFQLRKEEPRFKSRRFFAMYEFNDEWRVRAGRFLPAYGINLADHIVATRRPLGFDQGQERHNLEGSWLTDSWQAVLTASKGPSEQPENQQENALTAQLAYGFKDTYKVGANAWFGESDLSRRELVGAFATLGFSEALSLMSELDWQWSHKKSPAEHQTGFFNFNRLGYDLYKGVTLLGQLEYWQTDLSETKTITDRYGIGLQLFPRPHFDIQTLWTKQRLRSAGPDFEDYAWIALHYYL